MFSEILFFFTLLSSSNYEIRIIGAVLIGIIALIGFYYGKKRNNRIVEEGEKIKDIFNKNTSTQDNSIKSKGIKNSEKIDEWRPLNTVKNSNSKILIGVYKYNNVAVKHLLVIGATFCLSGLFADEGFEMFFFFLGFILIGTAVLTYLIDYSDHHSYVYKLYKNCIECYFTLNSSLAYTIRFDDIKNIDIEYGYVATRSGEKINEIFYLFKIKSSNELYKIEVLKLKNTESRNSFKEDFSAIFNAEVPQKQDINN